MEISWPSHGERDILKSPVFSPEMSPTQRGECVVGEQLGIYLLLKERLAVVCLQKKLFQTLVGNSSFFSTTTPGTLSEAL
jgi:hypothetical protein